MIKDGKFYKKKEGMKRMSKKILVTGCKSYTERLRKNKGEYWIEKGINYWKPRTIGKSYK